MNALRKWVRALSITLAFAFCVLQPSAFADVIRAGYDLSKTAYAYKLFDLDPIPAGAFGPGSDPFTGRIDWTSGPLTQFMGFSLPAGTVDTIVLRAGDAVLSGPGSSSTIPVQMVALSFSALHPISVTFDGGTRTEFWNVDAVASNNPVGTMTITQTSLGGGTFDSEFPVHPVFTFTRLSDGFQAVIDAVAAGLPSNVVKQEDVPWVFDPGTPLAADGAVLMRGMAFLPTNLQGQARGEHGHFASISNDVVLRIDGLTTNFVPGVLVPEPSVLVLTLSGMCVLAAVVAAKRRLQSPRNL